MELDGHIVEFVDSGALRVGYVRKREHRRVQIVDQRGRESSVHPSKVIVVHQSASEDQFPQAASGILAAVEERAGEIDLELLWDSVRADEAPLTLAELTEQYFGTVSAELESAMYRVLQRDSFLFRQKGTEFEPRGAEQVASARLRMEREREKEAFRTRIADMLRDALRGKPPIDDPEWNTMADRLERWLRQREKDEIGTIFEQITGTHQAREAAYDLLVNLGRIHDGEDRFLLIRGFPTVFSADASEAALGLDGSIDESGRVDWTGRPTLAIDDQDTVEIDDALTVLETENQRTTVAIHIADVATYSTKGDPLDREASRRTATIYLPNITVPMFPLRLSADLASLVPDATRPAFTIVVRFDRDDAIEDFEILRSVIRVSSPMTYERADEALAAGESSLVRLYRIARSLSLARSTRGAQTHRRPEIKVDATGDEIHVRLIDSDTPSRLIVSEMMILANRIAADHAAVQGIPVIYRTQEPSEKEPPDISGLPEAVQFELLRRSFKRSHLSLSPAPHAGLGLSAYTQLSSPIRRYADLVTQRQFIAALRGEAFPYDRDELLRIITSAEATEVEIRRLEQASTTYWVLTYLSREKPGRPLRAMVLDDKGTVELTDYLVRGKVPASDEWTPGDIVTVQIESIRPTAGEIGFRVCA